MKPSHTFRLPMMPMAVAAGLIVMPMLALSQTAPAPGAPAAPFPSSAPIATPPAVTTNIPGSTPGTASGTTAERVAPRPAAGVQAATATPGSAMLARPRMTQIIGSTVYNERDEKIGEVEDVLLVPPSGTPMPASTSTSGSPAQGMSGPVAILQVGGFLGIGGRLVSVPLGDLRWNSGTEHIVMPGATKEQLQGRPAFEYAMLRPR